MIEQQVVSDFADAVKNQGTKIKIINDMDDVDGDGFYILTPPVPVNKDLILTIHNAINFAINHPSQIIYENNATSSIIDWGDGTVETISNTSNNIIEHIYSERGDYTITIENVVGLGPYVFDEQPISSVILPDILTSIGDTFINNSPLITELNIPSSVSFIHYYGLSGINVTTLYLNWNESPLPTEYYDETYEETVNWIYPLLNNGIISIPHGTTSLYENAGYPSEQLVERSA